MSYNSLPDFAFNSVQLIVTEKCALGCTYCYAEGDTSHSLTMPLPIALAAVDKVIADAQKFSLPVIEVNFIGGEPTLAIDVVRKVIAHVRKKVTEIDCTACIGMVTNGCFNQEISTYLQDNLDYITISIDGPAEIHNKQRPFKNGLPSHAVITKNIRAFLDSNVTVGLRCTITQYSVNKMKEILTYLHNNFPGATIGVEPIQECGRCLHTQESAPNPDVYAENFIQALRLTRDIGLKLKSSITRFSNNSQCLSFCGVNGKNFSVTYNGNVTACTRVIHENDPNAKLFFFGQYNTGSNSFIFDQERHAWLKTLVTDSIAECTDCFARFNCKGDCPITKTAYSDNIAQTCSHRCESIKNITLSLLKQQLEIS